MNDRKLKNNKLNGTLEIPTNHNNRLRLIDLEKNFITMFENSDDENNVQIM